MPYIILFYRIMCVALYAAAVKICGQKHVYLDRADMTFPTKKYLNFLNT